MNVFTEISTRELENTLKGKAVRYIVNDAGEGLCLFFEGWTDNTGSNHGDAIHISPVIDAAGKPQLAVCPGRGTARRQRNQQQRRCG